MKPFLQQLDRAARRTLGSILKADQAREGAVCPAVESPMSLPHGRCRHAAPLHRGRPRKTATAALPFAEVGRLVEGPPP